MNGHSNSAARVDAIFAHCARGRFGVGRDSGAAAWLSPAEGVPRILPGYLTAFLYFLGLSLGSCVLLMIHGLTGGRWGMFIGRALSAAVAPLPLLALLFLPIAFGVEQLYPWATPDAAAHNPIVAAKSRYLNVEGFEVRAGVAFGLWLLLGLCLQRWTRPADPEQVAGRASPAGKIERAGSDRLWLDDDVCHGRLEHVADARVVFIDVAGDRLGRAGFVGDGAGHAGNVARCATRDLGPRSLRKSGIATWAVCYSRSRCFGPIRRSCSS